MRDLTKPAETPEEQAALNEGVLQPGMFRHALLVKDVCTIWHVTENTVVKWVRRQGAPCYTIDPAVTRRLAKVRELRFNYDMLLNWLEAANAI